MKKTKFMVAALIVVLAVFACQNKAKTNQQNGQTEVADTVFNADKFVGVWSADDDLPLVEITREGNDFKVREIYGSDRESGTEFRAVVNQENKLVAVGDPQNFYKLELPVFEQLPDGMLKYDCGVGPFELKKSDKKMPDVPYEAPKKTES